MTRRIPEAALLGALLMALLVIAAVQLLDGREIALAPSTVVTVYDTTIEGQRVRCTEIVDHATGARSRAC